MLVENVDKPAETMNNHCNILYIEGLDMDEQDPPAEIEKELVEHALSDVLDSPIFRSSKQCQLLLRYIVDHSLARQDDLLRERVIGASVFDRPPDYDTGNDPVVRGRAAEIRKRLAQYYIDHQEDSAVQISIPSGSYRAVFSRNHRPHSAAQPDGVAENSEHSDILPFPVAPEAGGATASAEIIGAKPQIRQPLLRSWALWTVMIATLAVLGGGWAFQQWQAEGRKHLFEQFWAPFSKSSKPTLIYIGTSPSLRLSPSYLENYRATYPGLTPPPGTNIDLPTTGTISTSDLIPYNGSIGFGDVAATARVASLLMSLGQDYDLRYGSDISISDMRSAPVVLIGGYSNSWTLKVTHDLRYTLEDGERIVDNKDKSKEWKKMVNLSSVQQNDYAVVSRLTSSNTGGVVLVIAGIRGSGNQATADFLSDPQQLEKLLQTAPSGWERMNMQVVLQTETINGVPKGADVQAVYYW